MAENFCQNIQYKQVTHKTFSYIVPMKKIDLLGSILLGTGSRALQEPRLILVNII